MLIIHADARHLGGDTQILVGGQVILDTVVMADVSHHAMVLVTHLADILPLPTHLTVLWPAQPAQRPQQRRLAGAIGAMDI